MIHDEFDPCKRAIINPEDQNPALENFPEICIGIFSRRIVEQMVERYGGEEIAGVPFCTGTVPLYRVTVEGTELALFMPHVGAPAAIAFIEDAVCWGGKYFVFFGSCGVLRHDIADGHLIVPTAAIRDEGTSYHYLPASDEIELEKESVQAVVQAMENLGLPHVQGKTWTTDAFFRETRKKMEKRKEQGCLCVEMECSALAAVSRFRGVQFAQFFYAADNLGTPQWDSRNLHQQGASVADKCIAAAVEVGRLLREGYKET